VSDPARYWKGIKPEVVDHYEVGLTHTWPELASVSATAFYDRGKDRFQAYMFGTIPTQFNDPIGRYRIRGLEFTGRVTPVKKFELFAGATVLNAKATGGNGVECNHLPYTPGFQIQAGADWTFLDNFRLFTDVQHLSNLYQGTDSRGNNLNFTQLTDKDKLDDMTLVNARLSYRFDYRPLRLSESEVYVAVNNIFNDHYEYAKGYRMPGTTVFAGFTMKMR
jgi:iron complex outermembrane receptor protein